MAHSEFAAFCLNTTWPREADPKPTAIVHLQLATKIDALPPAERLVLSLLYFEELTTAETATVMNRSTLDVCTLRDRALGILNKRAHER